MKIKSDFEFLKKNNEGFNPNDSGNTTKGHYKNIPPKESNIAIYVVAGLIVLTIIGFIIYNIFK